MINGRGWIVLLAVAALSVSAGITYGSASTERAWRADWTRTQLASVGALCKADRLK